MSSGKILKTLTNSMYIGNTIYEPQTIDRVIFLSSDDIFTEFKDSYTFNFSKYSKSGSTDLNDSIYSGSSNKLKISVNVVYQWISMDYAPRYTLEIVKNNRRRIFCAGTISRLFIVLVQLLQLDWKTY